MALKNEARAPAGAVANGRNIGILTTVTLLVNNKLTAAYPDSEVEVMLGMAIFAATVSFLGNIWRNVAASKEGDSAARWGKMIAGWFP